jgi:hypothetical protein
MWYCQYLAYLFKNKKNAKLWAILAEVHWLAVWDEGGTALIKL